MSSQRKITRIAVCLFAAMSVSAVTGCGSKQDETPASPAANPTLAPDSQSAMQAQQQADAADRAAHMGPPAKK